MYVFHCYGVPIYETLPFLPLSYSILLLPHASPLSLSLATDNTLQRASSSQHLQSLHTSDGLLPVSSPLCLPRLPREGSQEGDSTQVGQYTCRMSLVSWSVKLPGLGTSIFLLPLLHFFSLPSFSLPSFSLPSFSLPSLPSFPSPPPTAQRGRVC